MERLEFENGLSITELSKLLADWGRESDTAVLAEEAATLFGAACYRLWDETNHSYGYVSSAVPELQLVCLGNTGERVSDASFSNVYYTKHLCLATPS